MPGMKGREGLVVEQRDFMRTVDLDLESLEVDGDQIEITLNIQHFLCLMSNKMYMIIMNMIHIHCKASTYNIKFNV